MNDPLTIIHGDALSSLRMLESESVQCCVTSPPYWGLRDYGFESIVWGGDPGCDHKWGDEPSTRMRWGGADGASDKQKSNGGSVGPMDELKRGAFCECGAWCGQLGLEPTPELYVQHLVEIFREVRRVLRSDATLWLNLGDSYAHEGKGNNNGRDKSSLAGLGTQDQFPLKQGHWPKDCKRKDLVGIPWMVAFALRADGWYLRSDIIWSKPNPMPESVTDRPTKSHEYIFLLSKQQKYYYDAETIKEPAAEGCDLGLLRTKAAEPSGYVAWHAKSILDRQEQGVDSRTAGNGMRNKRSVWTVTTKPYKEAHFATFPPELIKPCILAGAEAESVVMDPFAGSGTTAKVAIELGRKAIAIEPKAEYVEMIKRRCQTQIGLAV